jgi:hypothetical protein
VEIAPHIGIVQLVEVFQLARAKDPPPGNAVMWRGVSRLTDIELGLVIGAQLVGN